MATLEAGSAAGAGSGVPLVCLDPAYRQAHPAQCVDGRQHGCTWQRFHHCAHTDGAEYHPQGGKSCSETAWCPTGGRRKDEELRAEAQRSPQTREAALRKGPGAAGTRDCGSGARAGRCKTRPSGRLCERAVPGCWWLRCGDGRRRRCGPAFCGLGSGGSSRCRRRSAKGPCTTRCSSRPWRAPSQYTDEGHGSSAAFASLGRGCSGSIFGYYVANGCASWTYADSGDTTSPASPGSCLYSAIRWGNTWDRGPSTGSCDPCGFRCAGCDPSLGWRLWPKPDSERPSTSAASTGALWWSQGQLEKQKARLQIAA